MNSPEVVNLWIARLDIQARLEQDRYNDYARAITDGIETKKNEKLEQTAHQRWLDAKSAYEYTLDVMPQPAWHDADDVETPATPEEPIPTAPPAPPPAGKSGGKIPVG